jgi:hypothetical protein
LVIPALANTQSEIDHLLTYVKTTPCTYIRNGSEHSGTDAAAHIKKKYDYFKDKIRSAEDFIRLSATKSTMTGSKYYIQCPNSPKVESATWLLAELKHFRSK